ncbi:choline transport protein [Moelleriella libera RCEF 2490]|uniref:Choline transport protein n=1 Tax=Moelleriella libera RCEF 2490 TaxID=1081109 RepID=A0A167VKM3_9HYPO|nr:choline transport protein [Moelleriella libera RCEF 2490]
MANSRTESRVSFNPNTIEVDEKRQVSIENADLTVQTQKPFGTLSAIGVGYGTTNTAVGLLLVLGSTIPFGGTPLFFWGFLLMIVVALATAISLAELASAMPHPGGQYIWVNQMAPARIRRGLSYCTAVMSWLGAVATGASACLSVSTGTCAIISLLNPDFEYKRWMGFVGFQVLNIVTMLCACFEHALPSISTFMLLFGCAACFAIFVTMLSTAHEHPSPKTFFIDMINTTGWPDGVSFLTGISGINWSLSCLDVATHLAEEIPSPAVNVPKALMWTCVVGFVAGMLVIVSIFVNVATLDPAADNSALALFYRISGNRSLAVGLWVPILFTTAGCVWSIQIWQSRLAWTISRDGGFPLHKTLARVLPRPFYTPIWSLIWSAACSALFGCLYLASEVAFNSLISTGILMQYMSYSIPVVLVLLQGRSEFQRGPFWMSELGMVANFVMLAWALTATLFYCFPFQNPVELDKMNYVSAVLGAIGVFIAALWFGYARKHYDVKYIRD